MGIIVPTQDNMNGLSFTCLRPLALMAYFFSWTIVTSNKGNDDTQKNPYLRQAEQFTFYIQLISQMSKIDLACYCHLTNLSIKFCLNLSVTFLRYPAQRQTNKQKRCPTKHDTCEIQTNNSCHGNSNLLI